MLASLFTVLILFANSFPLHLSMNIVDGDRIDLSHLGSKLFGKPVENDGENFGETDENPEEIGPYLEGDLLVPSEARNGMKAESLRWKNGEVPFEIRGSFTAHNMDMIERALIQYHRNTCIKFIPRRPADRDYISIESGSSGCWSSVGRTGGKQVVNLQTPGCVTKIGTVIHELLHALGFLHEQNREERDKFVIIKTSNIRSGYEINFDKAKSGSTSGFGVGYDYGSVMHYSSTAFSKNGQSTIEAKMKSNDKMGQREGFSSKDIEKVKKMYKCQKVTGTSPPTTTSGSMPAPSTEKPNGSIFGGIIDAFFPSSSMDEEEMMSQ